MYYGGTTVVYTKVVECCQGGRGGGGSASISATSSGPLEPCDPLAASLSSDDGPPLPPPWGLSLSSSFFPQCPLLCRRMSRQRHSFALAPTVHVGLSKFHGLQWPEYTTDIDTGNTGMMQVPASTTITLVM